MQTIEQTLYRKAATTRTGYNKETVAFNVPIPLFFDDDLFAIERGPRLTPDEPHDSAAPSASEKACGRLTGRAFAIHELPSLIDAMLSSKDMDGTIRRLSWDGTQAFVDVIDEALDRLDLPLSTKSKCLKLLHRTCGNYAILPGALKIPVLYDRTSNPLYSGGNSDVWKGEYCGRDVAVKVIRMYSNSDLRKVVGRFCKEVVLWRFLRHPNILPLLGVLMSDTRFAMVSHWMPNGNINEHVKAHPGLDRLELLTGVAGGLNYLHSIGMVHGDLKGSNVLIDEAGGARLADFGLLTIISDAANHLSSSTYTQGGTVRWMSPELIYPEEFGFKNSRPTKSSDCYALGMVIYETISGNPPFYECTDSHVALKVVAGEHPPRGVMFTQTLWKILESCWASRPNDRPNIEDILRRLENHCEVPESLHNPPGIGTWAGDTTAIGSTSVAPPLTHGIKPLFDLVSSVSRPPNPRSDCISGGTYLDFPMLFEPVQSAEESTVGQPVVPGTWLKIPQSCYSLRAGTTAFPRTPGVSFSVNGAPGINMQRALDQVFVGLDGRDDPALGCAGTGSSVSCRILFPGYPINRVHQIALRTWTKARSPITKSKLVYEIAKRVRQYMDSLAEIPIDPSIDPNWRIGRGYMKLDKMYLVNIAWVSRGSIQPEIWVDTDTYDCDLA